MSVSSESKIKEAAKKLFIERGFKNTTIRDIAELAGVNLSMMNYYFRSKDKLFREIIEERIGLISPIMTGILESDLSLEDKIMKYIDTYIELNLNNPDFPLFVVSEIKTNPERFLEISKFGRMYRSPRLEQQLKEEAEKGNIKSVDPRQFYLNLVSLVIFPFVTKPMVDRFYELDKNGFDTFMRERKPIIFNTLMSSIKP